MTLSEYKKMKSAAASAEGNGGMDDDSPPRSSSRIRSILGFSSRGRGGRARSLSRSSSRGRGGGSERERSASRPPSRASRGGRRRDSSRRSSSKSREGDDDDDDIASDSSSRRASRSTSTRGSASTRGDGGGSTKGRSSGDGSRSHHGRPRSQSPFFRRHEVEEFDDRRDRRSRTTKKHQDPSRPQPRSRSGRSPSHMAARVSMDGGTPCHEEKSTYSKRSRTKDDQQSLVRSGCSLEGNMKKGSDSNHCDGPLPHSSSDTSSARNGDFETAKNQLECGVVVVEDVNEDTDDDDYC